MLCLALSNCSLTAEISLKFVTCAKALPIVLKFFIVVFIELMSLNVAFEVILIKDLFSENGSADAASGMIATLSSSSNFFSKMVKE